MSQKISQFEAEVIRFKVEREKAAGLDTLARLFAAGFDIDGGTPERPNRPFSQNEWVYICVNAIVEAVRSVSCIISTADDKVVESGEAYDFLFTKNPLGSFSKFITETAGYLALYRLCYWVFLDKDLLAPKSLLVVGPDQLRPDIRSGIVTGYTLTLAGGQQVPLFLEDVWVLADFDPYKSAVPAGPAGVGRISISTDYQATLLNEAIFFNGGKLGNLITLPQGVILTSEERQLLITQFEARHGGARNAGKTCLMTGGADVKQLAQSMVDIQALDLSKFTASRICTLFGVPLEIAGLSPEAQYAHGPAQQRFIVNRIVPLWRFIAEHITSGILDKFRFRENRGIDFAKSIFTGSRLSLKARPSYRTEKQKAVRSNQKLFAWFDAESHPTIQEMQRETIAKVLLYTDKGVPLNQLIDVYDLPFNTEQIPWGNDWFISMGLVPARWTLEAGPEAAISPPYPGEQPAEEPPPAKDTGHESRVTGHEKADEARRLRLWSNWKISWAGLEREYRETMRQFFLRQQRVLTEKLGAALKESKAAEKANTDEIIARVVFDLQFENGKVRAINHTFFERASELGIRQALSEIQGLSGDKLNQAVEQAKILPAIRRALTISAHKISGINQTTQNLIARTLRAGLDAGEDLNGLTRRIQIVLGSNRARALSIARTQTAGAIDTGRHTGLKFAGVEVKAWVTAGDESVRSVHRQAGIDYTDGIPIDQPFKVGGEFLAYPGDPSGSAANIINCRCVEIALLGVGKTFGLYYYSNLKFYDYSDMQRDWKLKAA